MRLLVIGLLTLPGLWGQTFTTRPASGARYVGWNRPVYDPVSRQVITWWSDWPGSWGTPSIYVNSAYAFRTSDGTYTKLGTSNSGQGASYTAITTAVTRVSGQTFQTSWEGSFISLDATRFTIDTVTNGNLLSVASGSPAASGAWAVSCPNSTADWFGDRHTYGKMALDTLRNRILQVGGACSNPHGSDHPEDTWYLQMAPRLSGVRFFQSAAPSMSMGPGGGGMEYSPANDVYWLAHGSNYYLYCPTNTGTLTSAQTTYGCLVADEWSDKTSSVLNADGGSCSVSPYCPLSNSSPAWVQTGSKVVRRGEIFYWFNHNPTDDLVVWTFDPSTKRWTLLSTTSTPAPNDSLASRTELFDYDPINDLFWYYLPDNQHLYTFDPDTLAFTDLGVFASLPTISELAVYDPSQHSFIIWDGDEGSGDVGEAHVGKLPYPFSFNITLKEARFSGDYTGSGIARTDAPFCVGVPLKDVWNITTPETELELTGTSDFQFRALSYWPSGSVKWVEVCGTDTVSAGSTSTITVQPGSGNSGSNMATDGTPIVISTSGGTCGSGSAICFEIKKANHNGIDRVRIGGTTVVTASTSTGPIILGPDQTSGTTAGKVTCSPDSGGSTCNQPLTAANDADSTCSIEVNGPVKAVIKCTFTYEDASNNGYLKGTNRYYFFKGKSDVKIVSILRNADDGASDSFATAYKGHKGWEYRQAVNISGTLDYVFARHDGNETGTVAAADAIRLYQAQSSWGGTVCDIGQGCVIETDDTGYEIVKTVSGTPSILATGTAVQYVPGWADIADSSNVGVTIGAYLMSGRELMSLEWTNGEARIGLKTSHNTFDSTYTAYYEAWPEHSMREFWIQFNASAPSSPGNDFLSYQHRLLGYASPSHYNDTEVFGFKIPTSTEEDAWYVATEASATPTISGTPDPPVDKGLTPSNDLQIYHWWAWGNGASLTQSAHRLSDLLMLIKRGHTGRFLNGENFQRLTATMGTPQSDGFYWYQDADITATCFPSGTSLNSSKAGRDWVDEEHPHWYELVPYYLMTGEEWAKDGLDAYVDRLACGGYTTGILPNSRAVGAFLSGAAYLGEFYRDTANSDADVILTNATSAWDAAVKATLCINGDGTGCTYSYDGEGNGVNRARGVRRGGYDSVEVWDSGNGDSWCGDPIVGGKMRGVASFQTSTFLHGAREFRRVKGPDWADYILAGDLNYGVARYNLWENYNDNASSDDWDQSGFHYYMLIDQSNTCLGYTGSGTLPTDPDDYFFGAGRQTTNDTFQPIFLTEGNISSQVEKFTRAWQGILGGTGESADDYGGYQPGDVIYRINNPSGQLDSVTITDFTDNGGGSYTLEWTVPANVQSYRIKYHTTREIIDWLNYSKYATTYEFSPSTYAPWFAATEASNVPGPGPEGSTQSITIATGQTGLAVENFSVKAMVDAAESATFNTKVSGGVTVGRGTTIQ